MVDCRGCGAPFKPLTAIQVYCSLECIPPQRGSYLERFEARRQSHAVRLGERNEAGRQRAERKALMEAARPLTHEARSAGCARCGLVDDPRLFDLHHVDPRTKAFSLSDPPPGTTLDEVRAEIAKCVPLCPTCHRREHLRI